VSSNSVLAQSEAGATGTSQNGPLVIARQGSFFVGGTALTGSGTFNPTQNFLTAPTSADTYYVDQLYVQFQIPSAARSLPIVMVHGFGQTAKTWESTPDGREGYETIFTRRGFGVYVIDFPRRGRAGFPSFTEPLGNLTGTQIIPDTTLRFGNSLAFILFRLGQSPFTFFPNSQFPRSGLDQYFKQIIPAVMDDPDVISNAIAALFDRIGPAILLTHSQAGQFGWLAAMKSSNVKAIVAYEPAAFYFPTGAVPTAPPLSDGSAFPAVNSVALADFQKLTRIPIQIVYGDNIPASSTPVLGLDLWRVVTAVAPLFVSAINNQGGYASLLSLPSAGIFGNTHFPFADLNNLAVADLLSQYLHLNGLDH
jgi:pimeloyl-ACP methyl ester carboxylesterase